MNVNYLLAVKIPDTLRNKILDIVTLRKKQGEKVTQKDVVTEMLELSVDDLLKKLMVEPSNAEKA
jgi:hypothetical protein